MMRPPTTPRSSSSLGGTGSLPTPSRRKSSITPNHPNAPSLNRPPSALAQSAEAIAQLQSAMAKHHPSSYSTSSPYDDGHVTMRRQPSATSSTASVSASRAGTPNNPPATRQRTLGLSTRNRPSLSHASTSTSVSLPSSEPRVGDLVKAMDYEGTLKYLGTVDFKEGMYGGIELSDEWKGKGKNDGSVQGVRYFTCPPLCGIFVPAVKIDLVFTRPVTPSALPRAPSVTPSRPKTSAEAARLAQAKIQPGSRASRYLTMTAAQLASRPSASTSTSTTMAAPPTTPSFNRRRSVSPDKVAAEYAATTPRPAVRSRPSLGGLPTPRAPATSGRKSITPQTPTAAARLKRPPSRLSTPDVPPLPSAYTSTSSTSASGRMTPASTTTSTFSGRMTPSMRRTSALTDPDSLPSSSRPTSPLLRSQSRLSTSTASTGPLSPGSNHANGFEAHHQRVTSRPLTLASSGPSQAQIETLENERREALKTAEEARQAQVESEKALRVAQGRFEELRKRLEERESRVRALETASVDVEASAQDGEEVQRRMEELTLRLAEVEVAKAAAEQRAEDIKAEATERQAAGEQGLRLDLEQKFDAERQSLEAQLEQLREAGQALCSMYEERIAVSESDRIETETALRQVQTDLAQATEELGKFSEDPTVKAMQLDAVMASPSAAAIDNESLRAEVEHLRGRIGAVEEQRDEANAALENALQDGQRRRQESGDNELVIRKEAKVLKERLDTTAKSEKAAHSRSTELERALAENQRALETARAELEGLRIDAQQAEEAKRQQHDYEALRKDYEVVKREADEAKAQAKDYYEEMKLLEEIKRGEEDEPATPTRLTASMHEDVLERERNQFRQELALRESEIRSLRSRLGTLTPSTVPTNNDTVVRSSTPSPRASATLSSSAALSSKRDSAASSATSASSRRSVNSIVGSPILGGKDEVTAMREQIVGLKVIVTQMSEENRNLEETNTALKQETNSLRDSQRSLETTVDNLMAQIDVGAPSAKPMSPDLRRSSSSSTSDLELRELKTKLAELEKRSAREINALNAEVSDLEALVESKIFHEDELETELERYRNLVSSSAPPPLPPKANGTIPHSTSSPTKGHVSPTTDADRCELCGEKGHELDACPIFGGDAGSTTSTEDPSKAWCDDCETYGHSTERCPMADEVF